jgi:hypothetical protein
MLITEAMDGLRRLRCRAGPVLIRRSRRGTATVVCTDLRTGPAGIPGLTPAHTARFLVEITRET